MDDDERDRIEAQALTFFRQLYGDQAERTLAAIGDGDGDLMARINELYAGEAALGAEAYAGFWRAVMVAVAFSSLSGLVGADNPALNDDGSGISPTLDRALERYLAEMARLFGDRYSQNSLTLTFEGIERWREMGGDVGELRDILRGVWAGPRPTAASITETTRIVTLSRGAAWQEAESWGFNVNIRDVNTRDTHRAVANGGPYPWSMFEQMRPPVNGDVNCYCWITPVMENPNG